MKSTIIILSALLLVSLQTIKAQNINWQNLNDSCSHQASLTVGWDYALTYGLGYSYRLKTKFPLALSGEASIPSGNNVFDDFKIKGGIQAEVFRHGNFSVTAKASGIFRQSNSLLSRMDNFGSEFSAVTGYYKSKWHVAAEIGFDKAITTYIKNSEVMRESFPGVQDGWYIPTGGNFYYGILGGMAFKKSDVYLKLGKIVTQDFKTSPTIPLYFQLGFNRRF